MGADKKPGQLSQIKVVNVHGKNARLCQQLLKI